MVQVLRGQNKAAGEGLVVGTASISPGSPGGAMRAGTGCAGSRPTRDGAASPGTGRDAPRPPSLLLHTLGTAQSEGQMRAMQEGLGRGGTAKELAGAGTRAAPGFQLF